jgi:hypothetical protein
MFECLKSSSLAAADAKSISVAAVAAEIAATPQRSSANHHSWAGFVRQKRWKKDSMFHLCLLKDDTVFLFMSNEPGTALLSRSFLSRRLQSPPPLTATITPPACSSTPTSTVSVGSSPHSSFLQILLNHQGKSSL